MPSVAALQSRGYFLLGNVQCSRSCRILLSGIFFISFVSCEQSRVANLAPIISAKSHQRTGSAFVTFNPVSLSNKAFRYGDMFQLSSLLAEKHRCSANLENTVFSLPSTRSRNLPSIMMRGLPGRPISAKKEMKSSSKVLQALKCDIADCGHLNLGAQGLGGTNARQSRPGPRPQRVLRAAQHRHDPAVSSASILS